MVTFIAYFVLLTHFDSILFTHLISIVVKILYLDFK